jgi:hypothetical protein
VPCRDVDEPDDGAIVHDRSAAESRTLSVPEHPHPVGELEGSGLALGFLVNAADGVDFSDKGIAVEFL